MITYKCSNASQRLNIDHRMMKDHENSKTWVKQVSYIVVSLTEEWQISYIDDLWIADMDARIYETGLSTAQINCNIHTNNQISSNKHQHNQNSKILTLEPCPWFSHDSHEIYHQICVAQMSKIWIVISNNQRLLQYVT